MNKISESIFSCKMGIEAVIIPMADVQCIEIEEWGGGIHLPIRNRYIVKLKNGTIILKHHMGKKFMEAWCYYRHEVEGGNERFKNPIEMSTKTLIRTIDLNQARLDIYKNSVIFHNKEKADCWEYEWRELYRLTKDSHDKA